MRREDLQQIRYFESELKMLKEKLADQEEAIGIGSPKLTGMPKGNKVGRPTEEMACRVAETLNLIKNLEAKILQKRVEAWDFISSIDDSFIRQIFVHRYIDGQTWTGVAMKIGGGNTADCCRMAEARYWAHNTDD